MTVEATYAQVLEAVPALERIGATKLPPAAAIRIARLMVKLAAERTAYERARFELIKQHGGEVTGQRVNLSAPKPETGEADASFRERVQAFNEKVAELQAAAEAMQAETVSVDADKLPLKILEGADALSPADLCAIWPFVCEEDRP